MEAVDGQEVLKKIRKLDITSWNYTAQNSYVRHIGPMSQQFYKLFHVGDGKQSISMIDMDGVTILGIKTLYQQILDLNILYETDTLREQFIHVDAFRELNQRLDALEAELSK
jgi:hypothetical protein